MEIFFGPHVPPNSLRIAMLRKLKKDKEIMLVKVSKGFDRLMLLSL
jgi:hypothetical protein